MTSYFGLVGLSSFMPPPPPPLSACRLFDWLYTSHAWANRLRDWVLIPNDRSLHIYSPQRVGKGGIYGQGSSFPCFVTTECTECQAYSSVVRIGSPRPLTRRRVYPHWFRGGGGGTHSLAGEGAGTKTGTLVLLVNYNPYNFVTYAQQRENSFLQKDVFFLYSFAIMF
jgi:hypothetical protein